jgi:hypothetical protein
VVAETGGEWHHLRIHLLGALLLSLAALVVATAILAVVALGLVDLFKGAGGWGVVAVLVLPTIIGISALLNR